MCSRLLGKKLFYCFKAYLLLLVLNPEASADSILTMNNQVVSGRITSISSTTVTMLRGCDGTERVQLELKDARLINLKSNCSNNIVRQPSGGLQICEEPRREIFAVRLNNQAEPLLASSSQLTEDRV